MFVLLENKMIKNCIWKFTIPNGLYVNKCWCYRQFRNNSNLFFTKLQFTKLSWKMSNSCQCVIIITNFLFVTYNCVYQKGEEG